MGCRICLNSSDYTIGWICALPKELTAARAMLDEVYENPVQQLLDQNNYTVGRIGKYNIAITCLPSGEVGSHQAASVAIQMLTTFPSIKYGFMVGIGGGVPSMENDIRLGDVVVSTPVRQYGGVVQYDHGKSIQSNQWLPTGFLNCPPNFLRKTVSKLASIHPIEGHKIEEYLDDMASKHPDLIPEFSRPSLDVDILYEPEQNGSGTLSALVEIVRQPRLPSQLIRIHYGLIASGNQVMKSGRKRDQISKSFGGVLCFDMESAGVMNEFPCLVIRGISDYADIHKNKEWQAYAAAVAAAYAKEVINALPTLATEDKTDVSTETDGLWMVPFSRNERFVSREVELQELNAMLASEDSCQRVAVYGLGGVGKTQIALEFAYRKKEQTPNCSVFWVPANEPAAFEQAYRQIGKILDIPGIAKNNADIKQLIKEALSEEKIAPWLMIIDNADDIDILFKQTHGSTRTTALVDYLPFSRKGSILFTTRNRRAAIKQAGNKVICVDVMDMAEASKVLEKCLIRGITFDTAGADKLLNLLGCLPLAIVQAAAYMNENDTSIADYVDFYFRTESELIEILSENFEDLGRYKGTRNSIATTWLISFKQLQRQTPLAIEYLSFMACLLRHSIPQSILPPAPSQKHLHEAVGALTAYSLVTRQENREIFDMHHLVYLATRNWLRNKGSFSRRMAKAAERLADIIPHGGHKGRDTWTMYLPHATHLLTSKDLSKHDRKVILLSDNVGKCLYSNGEYLEAEQMYQQTLNLKTTVLGDNHPDTLKSAANLAEALSHRGQYKAAERMHRKTLEARKRILGKRHPDVMVSMQYLAQVLVLQGRLIEAEQMHRETRYLRIKVLGAECPSTLSSMSYLAECLSKLGRYADAEQMHEQTLKTRIKVLGLEYPATLASMSCLGVAQLKLGKYSEAERTQREVLAHRIKVLGSQHPHTLITKRWLVDTLQHQGKYDEAMNIIQEVLELQRKLLGYKHPDTLCALSSLADIHACQNNLDTAKDLYQEISNIRTETLGSEHPHTLSTMSSLAEVLYRQNQWKEAETIYRKVFDLRLEYLGLHHPDTLLSLSKLTTLEKLNKAQFKRVRNQGAAHRHPLLGQ
ncbi:violaceus kinesin [Xylogone sp. PMI_703]|nr:violaceus kinesin [Xylogone sp. PMI_703]